jgi:subtilisin family serine protease
MKKGLLFVSIAIFFLAMSISGSGVSPSRVVGINIVLNTEISNTLLTDLANYGTVLEVFREINALTIRTKSSFLETIQALPYVAAANPDRERQGIPIDTVSVDNFADGLSTWNLDAINVTDYGFANRVVDYDGAGVYVAVLDTGLVDIWRQYFPEERIATEYSVCFGGGGGGRGWVSTQPNKWEHDTNSHGTHVTSTILGYSFYGMPINGVAPMANVIPVKVLNQTGWGWSSVITRGILYVALLKEYVMPSVPMVINMSLSGGYMDVMEKAAIDYAIAKGVIVVAAAGNRGNYGMGYPGAYEPVISVAAASWIYEGFVSGWWYALDVLDPTDPSEFYIPDFSSREKTDQHLDVAAPGSSIVGPLQYQMGKISYYYSGGTSMACPHVAGIVALMAEKNPGLTAAQAESFLETTAIWLTGGWTHADQGAGLVNAAAALLITP